MKTLICLVLIGCGSVTGPAIPDAEHVAVSSIAVTPNTLKMKRGLDAPTQLAAMGMLTNQTTVDFTTVAQWTSSNASVATVAGGLVTPVAPGMTTITATYDGVIGTSAVTTVNPKIYLTEANSPAGIDVFDAFANGDVPPLQALSGALTGLAFPWSVQVVDDEIYVSDPSASTVAVWPSTATGNVAPSRQLKGVTTTLSGNYAMTIFNHEIFVATGTSIVVFPTTATGNVAPARTIAGPTTGITAQVYSMVVYKNELYVLDEGAHAIHVYPTNATGDVAPTRTIAGPMSQLAGVVIGIDVVGDEIYVVDEQVVRVYPASANGDTAPIRVIIGPDTAMSSIIDVKVVGSELFSSNYASGGVHVHPRDATSDVPPTRNINGVMSTVRGPRGLTVY